MNVELDHYQMIYAATKRMPVWKCVVFGLNCIRQEFEIYQRIAKDRPFDMTKHLTKVVDRFWQAAATGYSMDEKYLMAIEESRFAPQNPWEELCLSFVLHLLDYFYAVYDKDDHGMLAMMECQMEFIHKYLELSDESYIEDHPLIIQLCHLHKDWAAKLSAVPNKEKKNFLSEYATVKLPLMLDEKFEQHLPECKLEKSNKRLLPEIRETSIEFDHWIPVYPWLDHATAEQLAYHGQKAAGAYSENYDQKRYTNLCHIMDVSYRLYAEDDFARTRNVDRVRGFWYMSAKSELYAYKLYEQDKLSATSTTKYDLEHPREWIAVIYKMMEAYAAGADELLEQLQHFSSIPEISQAFLDMIYRKDDSQIRERIVSWDGGDLAKGLLMILDDDVKELRKLLLARIRSDRKGYELNRVFIDCYCCALYRLAHNRGMDVKPIHAAEILFSNAEFKPLKEADWKLPYEDEIKMKLHC